jgi:ABC-type transport system involved in multi-copper enzyme maturation permease subunit
MSYYLEYLRGLRALRIVAILLGLLIAGALIARLSWGKLPSQDDYVNSLERSPTAHVTRTRLPHGRSRTVIDDSKRGTRTVVERDQGTVTSVSTMTAGSPYGRARNREGVRSATASPGPRGDTATTTTTTTTTTTMPSASVHYSPFDIGSLFAMAIPVGLLAATLLGGPLSKENNGHLEFAWTKPVSRARYALSAMLVDLATIAVAEVATVLALLLASLFWDVPKVSFDALAPAHVAFALLAPAAWYACLTALSASLKRGPGAVLGIGWVVAVVCPTIALATQGTPTAVGRAVYAFFNTISYADPITYLWFRNDWSGSDPARAVTSALLSLAALTVVYLALAVVQWRRVEA